LTPVTSKTDNSSTVPNAISNDFAKTGQKKKELVVDSPSTDEITSESSATLTDYSRKLDESNSTTKLLGKRFASTAPPFTISFSDQRKRKIFIKTSQRKRISQINSNSSAENYSVETEYTRSISMENQQTDQLVQPFSFNMELTTGTNPAEFMRTINARFVSMAKAINGSQVTLAQPVQQRRKRVTQGQRKAAARVFMEPSGESGFTSVNLPCRRRMPISELRGNLRKLKIANFRVFDVSYPAQKVVALLVHQEYAKELFEKFETAGVKPIENFDPLDGKVISDPKWVDKTEAERADLAHTIYRVRCLVALIWFRVPVKYAVARYFVCLGWVEGETLQRMQTGDQLAPPREQGDLEMRDSSATAAAAFRAASELPQVGADTSSDFSSWTRASSLLPRRLSRIIEIYNFQINTHPLRRFRITTRFLMQF
jgi:hypothetical protein